MAIEYGILHISPDDPDFETKIFPTISCDQKVYGTDPTWCEGKKCEECTQTTGKPVKWSFQDAPDRCTICGGMLLDYWSIEGLLADYREDAKRTNYTLVVAHDEEKIVGGFRGWAMTAEELDAHLNDVPPKHSRITPSLLDLLHERFPEVQRFAYEASIFVLPEYQDKQIGKTVTTIGQQVLWDCGLRVFVMRTKTKPHAVSFDWYSNHGYEQIGEYNDADGRVVLARVRLSRP